MIRRQPSILYTLVFCAAFIGGISIDLSVLMNIHDSELLITGSQRISLIQLLVFTLAIVLWQRHRPNDLVIADLVVLLLAAALLLIPSAKFSWVILFFLGLWLYHRAKVMPQRYALLILMALSANELLSFVLLKFVTIPVLTVDAMLTAGLLQLVTGVGGYEGNLVSSAAEHQLLLLRGCSSLSNLSLALLVWFSVARFRLLPLSMHDIRMAALITLAIVGINIVRLMWMAADVNMHSWWHSNEGEQIYQLVYAFILLFMVQWGVRRES